MHSHPTIYCHKFLMHIQVEWKQPKLNGVRKQLSEIPKFFPQEILIWEKQIRRRAHTNGVRLY